MSASGTPIAERMVLFEYVFTLFGLLLGLSLAEILRGLGRVLRTNKPLRVGWLTPLLGLLLMLDLVSFWSGAWQMRAGLTPSYLTLVFGLIVTGLYYLAATLVVPDDFDRWPDLDAHYFAYKRQVLAGVMLCNAMAYTADLFMGPAPWPMSKVLIVATFFMLLIATIAARRQRACLLLHFGLLLLYAISGVLGVT
jgi:hypothetical protein